jgi:predicted dehydrogenase
MAYSLEQSREMMKARDRNKRVLQIGQQRRSSPLYYLAERLVQKDGLIGEIIRADAFWDRSSDWKRDVPTIDADFKKWGFPTANHLINWRLFREYGHGLMTENGTHQMDAMSWLLGNKRPQRVCGLGVVRYGDDRETYDACSAEYMFDGDVIVRFHQDFHQGFNYGWSYGELLLGREGALRVTAEQEIFHYDTTRRARKIPIAEVGDEFEIAGVTCTKDEMNAAEQDREKGGLRTFSYFNEMRIFVDSIRNNHGPACTGEIGHNSIAYTIVGADAQYAGEYRDFAASDFV